MRNIKLYEGLLKGSSHHYPKDMIEMIILGTMKKIVNDKEYYFSFILAPVAINFLGQCLSDDTTFNSKDDSSDFDRCINDLMDKYKNIGLYEKLRNGMLNMMKPSKGIAFTHNKEAKKMGVKHMDKEDGGYVLVAEELWSDIYDAANKIIKMKFSKDDKMNKPFINIPKEK